MCKRVSRTDEWTYLACGFVGGILSGLSLGVLLVVYVTVGGLEKWQTALSGFVTGGGIIFAFYGVILQIRASSDREQTAREAEKSIREEPMRKSAQYIGKEVGRIFKAADEISKSNNIHSKQSICEELRQERQDWNKGTGRKLLAMADALSPWAKPQAIALIDKAKELLDIVESFSKSADEKSVPWEDERADMTFIIGEYGDLRKDLENCVIF